MKRYSPIVTSFDDDKIELGYIEDVEGNWVRWEDVKEIVEEYQKIINEEQNDINYL